MSLVGLDTASKTVELYKGYSSISTGCTKICERGGMVYTADLKSAA